jgi:hypothetical protein
MNCWSIADEAEEAFRWKFLMTCVSCWIITQLYILMRRTNEITNVAGNIAGVKASALRSHLPGARRRRAARP